MARTDGHPDAETIFRRVRERIPTISLDTVYRTLSLLEEKGLLKRLELFSDRMRYDANTEHHHHLICTRCGQVRDFQTEQIDEVSPRSRSARGATSVRCTCNCEASARSASPGMARNRPRSN